MIECALAVLLTVARRAPEANRNGLSRQRTRSEPARRGGGGPPPPCRRRSCGQRVVLARLRCSAQDSCVTYAGPRAPMALYGLRRGLVRAADLRAAVAGPRSACQRAVGPVRFTGLCRAAEGGSESSLDRRGAVWPPCRQSEQPGGRWDQRQRRDPLGVPVGLAALERPVSVQQDRHVVIEVVSKPDRHAQRRV